MRIKNYLTSSALIFFLIGCNTVKEVNFKNPVDTTSKTIAPQIKGTYIVEDLGLYASNEFDGARLNGLEKINDSTATVIINPENEPINKSPYYAFKIWTKTPKEIYLTFKYPNGYKHRYIPKLGRHGEWQIIDSMDVYKTKKGVTIKLNTNNEPLLVAAQELQTSTDVKNWYTKLSEGRRYVHPKIYGESLLGRDLPVLDIYKGKKENKPLVILLTRQHPPEVTGYFAFKEFLSTILNDSELSSDFLSRYRVLAFPILNPDGVDLGHWRHNAGGVDLNRDWSVYNQPEIKQTVKYIQKQLQKSDSKITLGLDFHSTWHDVFYTNKRRKGTSLPNFIHNWFNALEENLNNYKVNEDSGNSTKPVSKGWFLFGHNATGVTYEIGDTTPKARINEMGKISANAMMRILLKDDLEY